MSADGIRAVFRRLRRLTDPGSTGLSDAELVDRYARSADDAAFELLLWRHGPMVLGVCRRLLGRAEDAEDAFQATFLTFVRKVQSVRRGGAVGAWLYRVAYRVALRARATVASRGETGAEPASPADDAPDRRDLRLALDEEVRRLPARYRDPVVLCYLEGRTHAEAARELGCPKGTVAVRLLRARKLLQNRLTRRGVTLAVGVAALVAPPASAALVAQTLRLAAGGPVSVRVLALTEGVIRAMSLTYLKTIAAIVLVSSGLLVAGTTVLSRPAAPPEVPPAAEPERPAPPAPGREEKSTVVVRVPSRSEGQLLAVGVEIAPGEDVPADQRVTVTVPTLLMPVREGDMPNADQPVISGANNTRWRPWQEGDPLVANQLYVHKTKKQFRPLEVGDRVRAGQVIAFVDPRLALGELNIKIAALDASESERRAARKTKEEAERRVAAMEESMRRVPGSVSKDDYEGAKLTAKRYFEDEIARVSAIVRTQQELIQAWTILNLHEVRVPVSGVVRTIEREPGEAVKALDTVITVETPRKSRRAPDGAKSGKLRDVRAEKEGQLTWLGSELKPGESLPADRVVTVGSGANTRRYRLPQVGDTVAAGQLLGLLYNRDADDVLRTREVELESAEVGLGEATREREVAERQLKAFEEAEKRAPGSYPRNVEAARQVVQRCRGEEAKWRNIIRTKRAILEQARALVANVDIRSPVRGFIREVLRRPGEQLRAGDLILSVAVAE